MRWYAAFNRSSHGPIDDVKDYYTNFASQPDDRAMRKLPFDKSLLTSKLSIVTVVSMICSFCCVVVAAKFTANASCARLRYVVTWSDVEKSSEWPLRRLRYRMHRAMTALKVCSEPDERTRSGLAS